MISGNSYLVRHSLVTSFVHISFLPPGHGNEYHLLNAILCLFALRSVFHILIVNFQIGTFELRPIIGSRTELYCEMTNISRQRSGSNYNTKIEDLSYDILY